MATIKDVAREAGVAVSTVSKYINGGNVLEENRSRIDEAIQKLGYKMNFHAHVMRSGESGMVLILVPKYDDHHCCQMMRTARELLLEKGYIAILAESGSDQKNESEILLRAINHQVEGVIALNTDMAQTGYDELRQHHIPLVVIGKSYRKKHAGSVYFDDADKYVRLFRKIRDNGHVRVGVVGGSLEVARQQTREFAYYVGLFRKVGLEVEDRNIFVKSGPGLEIGIEAVDYFLNMPDPPTAIICMNSELLTGAYIALRERGLKVPDDISLCVSADVEELTAPPFNYFDALLMPVREATEKAVNILMDNIQAKGRSKGISHTTVQLRVELRSGCSIGPCPKGQNAAE